MQERVKELRKEHDWSQGELAEGVDAISRMRTGAPASPRQPTPSSAWLRCSTSRATTCSSMTPPRRRFRTPEDALGDHLATVAELGADDLHLVVSFIEALVTKTRLAPTLAGGIS